MNAQQLKNSILQEAIEGRLVPQDPNDEPASVLLDKIRKEKARLVKEGKLKKKDIIYNPVAEEEKTLEIPNNWEWCRLGEIGIFERGNGIKRDETSDYGYPCVRYGEMYTKYKYSPTFAKTISFTNKDVFDKCRKAHKGDLFMALTGENKQDISLAAQYVGEEEIAVGGDLCHFTILEAYALYFVYLINSKFFSNRKEPLAKGDIIVHISTDKLSSIAIPLPPLAEQKRIVAKIEKLMPKVEEYGKAQQALDKLNEELPERLKKSILQEAIEGRLVPQDPNDEPASALLDKIRKEKVKLVKEGKLKKKDLEETPISEDEIPFKIPDSWEWCKIGSIFNHSSGKQLSGSNNDGELHDYITTSNLYWGRFELDNLKSMYFKESELEKCTAKKGDLLVCEGGDVGRSAIWTYDYDICLQNHVHRLRPYDDRYTEYIFYTMWFYKSTGLIGGKGIGIQGLSASALKSIVIPLPPLAEQQRIVAKIEQLMKEIEKINV